MIEMKACAMGRVAIVAAVIRATSRPPESQRGI
jgi:hypothetical protein